MKRILQTLRICYYTFMARTYGEYLHSQSMNDEFISVYRWRGEDWGIPSVTQQPKKAKVITKVTVWE